MLSLRIAARAGVLLVSGALLGVVAGAAYATVTHGPSAVAPAGSVADPGDAVPSMPLPGPFLDMRTVGLEGEGVQVKVPAGIAGCPTASLRFTLTTPRTTVNGVEYSIHAGSVAYGDLTGDGFSELAIVVRCGEAGQALLVLAATGDQTYGTIAGRSPGSAREAQERVDAVLIRRGALVTYNVYQPRSAATAIRTWTLRSGALQVVAAHRAG